MTAKIQLDHMTDLLFPNKASSSSTFKQLITTVVKNKSFSERSGTSNDATNRPYRNAPLQALYPIDDLCSLHHTCYSNTIQSYYNASQAPLTLFTVPRSATTPYNYPVILRSSRSPTNNQITCRLLAAAEPTQWALLQSGSRRLWLHWTLHSLPCHVTPTLPVPYMPIYMPRVLCVWYVLWLMRWYRNYKFLSRPYR